MSSTQENALSLKVVFLLFIFCLCVNFYLGSTQVEKRQELGITSRLIP